MSTFCGVPKFRQNSSDSEAICPYCGEEWQVEAEAYSDEEEIVECENCSMKFKLTQDYTVTHYSSPDCTINGAAHQYAEPDWSVLPGVLYICEVCGDVLITGLPGIRGELG